MSEYCRDRWYANREGQRSHECERGTQECVRHKTYFGTTRSVSFTSTFSNCIGKLRPT